MYAKQIKFREIGTDVIHARIQVENIVVCGCCGYCFNVPNLEILAEYENWVPLEHEITGDENYGY